MFSIEEFYNKFFQPGLICADTRILKPGDIFVALRGTNYNGSAFAEEANKKGAILAVIDDIVYKKSENILVVDNSLKFLQELAQYHRKVSNFHVIGLTGSNGKTTTKELLKIVLSEKYKCLSTEGNLNNHIGVPLTLLSITKDTDYAIVEMGANHPGEIRNLCEISLPDSGIITNIGRAHLEGLGGIEGVKKTKAELYDFIKKRGGKIYYNAANPVLTEMIGNYPNAVSFNTDDGLCKGKIETVYPSLEIIISDKQNSKINLSTNLFGEYNLENLLAAACVGLDLSLSLAEIKNGIEKYYPSNNRSQIIKTGTITFFLDCYNANPSSMQEALLSFSKLESNKKVVILGGMKELGIFSVAEHKKLGKIIESYNFMEIILIGEEFKGLEIFNSKHFDSVLDLKDYFSKIKYSNTHILVKGSRANRLEKILEYFS